FLIQFSFLFLGVLPRDERLRHLLLGSAPTPLKKAKATAIKITQSSPIVYSGCARVAVTAWSVPEQLTSIVSAEATKPATNRGRTYFTEPPREWVARSST